MEKSSEEIAEIERHKYFLSEKRGYDVGWETAEQDWEENFAEQWRRDSGQHDCSPESESVVSESCESELEQATAEVVSFNSSRVIHVDPPSEPKSPVGSLKRLFSRLLSKSTSS